MFGLVLSCVSATPPHPTEAPDPKRRDAEGCRWLHVPMSFSFALGSSEYRVEPHSEALLDDLAEALRDGRLKYVRLRGHISLGCRIEPSIPGLELARAETIQRQLLGRSAPPDSISVVEDHQYPFPSGSACSPESREYNIRRMVSVSIFLCGARFPLGGRPDAGVAL